MQTEQMGPVDSDVDGNYAKPPIDLIDLIERTTFALLGGQLAANVHSSPQVIRALVDRGLIRKSIQPFQATDLTVVPSKQLGTSPFV